MNLQDLSTQLLLTTLPLWVDLPAGQNSQGTAFIYECETRKGRLPFAITNRHVVEHARKTLIEMRKQSPSAQEEKRGIKIDVGSESNWHIDRFHDLAALPIGGIINQLNAEENPVLYKSISPDLIPTSDESKDYGACEEVVFVGYPRGLYDQINITPLFRRGITASPFWNDFNGEPSFVIDAGVFPGSSGSPVFFLNQGMHKHGPNLTIAGTRLVFLGLITDAFVVDKDKSFMGLGNVLKSHVVRDFVRKIADSL